MSLVLLEGIAKRVGTIGAGPGALLAQKNGKRNKHVATDPNDVEKDGGSGSVWPGFERLQQKTWFWHLLHFKTLVAFFWRRVLETEIIEEEARFTT